MPFVYAIRRIIENPTVNAYLANTTITVNQCSSLGARVKVEVGFYSVIMSWVACRTLRATLHSAMQTTPYDPDFETTRHYRQADQKGEFKVTFRMWFNVPLTDLVDLTVTARTQPVRHALVTCIYRANTLQLGASAQCTPARAAF